MKSSIFVLAVAFVLATTAAAAPQPEAGEHEGVELEKRRGDNCYFKSHCSMSWSGKCQNHCGKRKFSHMSKNGCGWFEKRCCCVR
ncbi:hypothetical protein DFQ27_008778, partial [Actinomortierella ambigua]